MQVFRLMALPDKVIAFDELPERLVAGFNDDMCRADAFPRYWKEFLGKRKKITHIPPEKDFLTGGVRRFDPIVEENYFFYLVDWRLEPAVDRWIEICAYVKQHAIKGTVLLDKIEDMAKPLAANQLDSVTLEPEDVTVIKLEKEAPELAQPSLQSEPVRMFKCKEDGCPAEFEKKQGMIMHTMKKHPKPVAV